MRRKILGAALTASLMIGVSAGSALATPAVGSCPPGGGWTMSRSSDPEYFTRYDVGNGQDGNSDTHSCYKVNRGLSKKHGQNVFVWHDNTGPIREI